MVSGRHPVPLTLSLSHQGRGDPHRCRANLPSPLVGSMGPAGPFHPAGEGPMDGGPERSGGPGEGVMIYGLIGWRKHARAKHRPCPGHPVDRQRGLDAGRAVSLVPDGARTGGDRTVQSAFRARHRGCLRHSGSRRAASRPSAPDRRVPDGHAGPVPAASRLHSCRRAANRGASRIGRLGRGPAVHLAAGPGLPCRRPLVSCPIQGGPDP